MPDKKLCEDCHHVIEVMASKPTEYAGNCECGGKLRIKTSNEVF